MKSVQDRHCVTEMSGYHPIPSANRESDNLASLRRFFQTKKSEVSNHEIDMNFEIQNIERENNQCQINLHLNDFTKRDQEVPNYPNNNGDSISRANNEKICVGFYKCSFDEHASSDVPKSAVNYCEEIPKLDPYETETAHNMEEESSNVDISSFIACVSTSNPLLKENSDISQCEIVSNSEKDICTDSEDIVRVPGLEDTSSTKSIFGEASQCEDLSEVDVVNLIPKDLACYEKASPHVCSKECIGARKRCKKCPICLKKFVSKCKIFMKNHFLFHTGGKMFKCPQCSRKFPLMGHLHSHMRHHTKTKFRCSFCKKEFYNKHGMLYHEGSHTDKVPFRCICCGDLFRTNEEFIQHQLSSGEKPYKCDVCKSEFKWMSLLHLHKRMHRDNFNHYSCKHCGRLFKWSAHFYSHLKHFHKISGL